MLLSGKLQRWVEQGLISAEQSSQIAKYEKQHSGGMFLKISFTLAGLLIGLGICLVIGANWDGLPVMLRLFGVFAVFAGFIYGLCRTYVLDKAKLREFFLILCSLMIGATIGLIGQMFNLDGGWQSFALSWSILALPYVFFSRSRLLNGAWFLLLLSGLEWGHFFERMIVWWPWLAIVKWEYYVVPLMIVCILFFCGLSWIARKIDEKIHQYTVIGEAVAIIFMFMAYYTLFWFGLTQDIFHNRYVDMWLIRLFVVAFLVGRMLMAVHNQNVVSFKRNAFLLELYIFAVFAIQFSGLLTTGIGFIACGLLILLLIKVLRYTSRYIKNMEIFND